MSTVADLITQGLQALELVDDPDRVPDLVARSNAYLALLARWNRVTNLTAVTDIKAMVGVHLLDSFSIAPYITGQKTLDVGSGAGLPGIPLALLYPDKDFILLDSNGKKTRFMTQAIIDLQLTNVEVVHRRVEEFTGEFDQVVCRAFGSLDLIAEKLGGLLARKGEILAMKGSGSEQPPAGFDVECHEIKVPLIEARRQLICLTRIGD
jgi:16S rRNA (guanine527-N7)-methyltransferase